MGKLITPPAVAKFFTWQPPFGAKRWSFYQSKGLLEIPLQHDVLHDCPRDTGLDGDHVFGVDHDHIRPRISENTGFYRRRRTWINFTPHNGWHDILKAPRKPTIRELEKAGLLCGGKLLPAHDILWWVPGGERIPGQRIRGVGASYFCHEPTTVNGHAYFWLDEKKMNSGELEIRRLDL